jgi:hypothetical protein
MAPKKIEMTLTEALADVSTRLDAPSLEGSVRKRLLQRQAELGDLRDDLAARARRRSVEDGPALTRR